MIMNVLLILKMFMLKVGDLFFKDIFKFMRFFCKILIVIEKFLLMVIGLIGRMERVCIEVNIYGF